MSGGVLLPAGHDHADSLHQVRLLPACIQRSDALCGRFIRRKLGPAVTGGVHDLQQWSYLLDSWAVGPGRHLRCRILLPRRLCQQHLVSVPGRIVLPGTVSSAASLPAEHVSAKRRDQLLSVVSCDVLLSERLASHSCHMSGQLLLPRSDQCAGGMSEWHIWQLHGAFGCGGVFCLPCWKLLCLWSDRWPMRCRLHLLCRRRRARPSWPGNSRRSVSGRPLLPLWNDSSHCVFELYSQPIPRWHHGQQLCSVSQRISVCVGKSRAHAMPAGVLLLAEPADVAVSDPDLQQPVSCYRPILLQPVPSWILLPRSGTADLPAVSLSAWLLLHQQHVRPPALPCWNLSRHTAGRRSGHGLLCVPRRPLLPIAGGGRSERLPGRDHVSSRKLLSCPVSGWLLLPSHNWSDSADMPSRVFLS